MLHPDHSTDLPRLGLAVTAPLRRPASERPGPSGLDRLVELARLAEELGFDAFFVDGSPGEIGGLPAGAGAVAVDPFVVLGAVAVSTSRLQLGCLAPPLGSRPPALLAKTVTSLDVCSDGRAVLALGPPADDQLDETGLAALSEALEVCRALVRVPAPSFAGSHHQLERAWNEPRWPHEAGGPPVALAVPAGLPLAARSGLLDLAVRHAELCVLEPGPLGPGELAEVRERLAPLARRAGRLPGQPRLLARLRREAAVGGDPGGLARGCLEAGADGVIVDWSAGEDAAGLAEIGSLLAPA